MKTIFERTERLERPLVLNATAFTAASSAAIQLHSTGTGQYVAVFEPDQNCHIVFGDSAVRPATTSDFRLTAGKTYKFSFSTGGAGFFRVIRATADGTLDWFVLGKV